MAVRQLRRLDQPAARSLYDEMEAQALNTLYFRRDVARVEQKHPELILRRGPNVLLAHEIGAAKLAYSYESDRAFTELFPAMLETLLPRVRRLLGAETVRFRLSHSPSRPLVEPVIKRLSFRPKREWLQFDMARCDAPKPTAVEGVRFRAATLDDADAIARIDLEAFPDSPMPAAAIRAELKAGNQDALVAMRGRDAVGYSAYALPDAGFGYIHALAVSAPAQREGIGQALTARALKQLFAEGAQDVALTTDQVNGPAIRMYVKMGFRQTKSGRDYERLADPKAIERLAKQAQTTMIKFGGWR